MFEFLRKNLEGLISDIAKNSAELKKLASEIARMNLRLASGSEDSAKLSQEIAAKQRELDQKNKDYNSKRLILLECFRKLIILLPSSYSELKKIFEAQNEILSAVQPHAEVPNLSDIYYGIFKLCLIENQLDFFLCLKELAPQEFNEYRDEFLVAILKADRLEFLIALFKDFSGIEADTTIFNVIDNQEDLEKKKAQIFCQQYKTELRQLCLTLSRMASNSAVLKQNYQMRQGTVMSVLSEMIASEGDLDWFIALYNIHNDVFQIDCPTSDLLHTPIANAWLSEQNNLVSAMLNLLLVGKDSKAAIIDYMLLLIGKILSCKITPDKKHSTDVRDVNFIRQFFNLLSIMNKDQKNNASLRTTIFSSDFENRLKGLIRTALLETRIESLNYLCEFYLDNKIAAESELLALLPNAKSPQGQALQSAKKPEIELKLADFLLEILASPNTPLATKSDIDKFFKYVQCSPNAESTREQVRIEVAAASSSTSALTPTSSVTITSTSMPPKVERRNSIAASLATSLPAALRAPFSAPAALASTLMGAASGAVNAATAAAETVADVTAAAAETMADATRTAAVKVVDVTDAVKNADGPGTAAVQASRFGKR